MDEKNYREFNTIRRSLFNVKSMEEIDDWYSEEKIDGLIDFICREMVSKDYISDQKLINRASKILMQIAKTDPLIVMSIRKRYLRSEENDDPNLVFNENNIFKWFREGRIAQNAYLDMLYAHNSTGVDKVDVSNYIDIIELMKMRMGYDSMNEFIRRLMNRFSIGWNNYHFLEDEKEREEFIKRLPRIEDNMLTEYPPELSKQSIRLMKYLTTSIAVSNLLSMDKYINDILEGYVDGGKIEHAKYAMAVIDNLIKCKHTISDTQLRTIIKTEQTILSNIKNKMDEKSKKTVYYKFYRNYTSVILHSIDYIKDLGLKRTIKTHVIERLFTIDRAYISKAILKDGLVICRDEVLANAVKCLRKFSTDPNITGNDNSLSYLTDVIDGDYKTSSSDLRVSIENDSLVAIHNYYNNYSINNDIKKEKVKSEIIKMIEIQDGN